MGFSRFARIVLAIVCLMLAACSSSSKEKTPLCGDGGVPAVATSSVTVADFSFTPECIQVPLGTTVTWTNTGLALHTVTSEPGAPVTFDSGPLGENGVFTFTFNQTGVVNYRSTAPQSLDMAGTVVVR